MFEIAGVLGPQYLPTNSTYSTYQEQYASSTYQEEHELKPGLIVLAKSIQDIRRIVRYANEQKVALAIRTGGHQYSGASSTGPRNVQLDLSQTFKRPEDLEIIGCGDKTLVRASVSWSVGEFTHFLSDNKLFAPTGQCAKVCLGGHVQTGGYGQLMRNFGLLGDYVSSLELVNAEGDCEEVTRSEDDKFYALLGGSPGNLGVLTHFTLEVQRDNEYAGSLGLLAVHRYSRYKLARLLGMLATMSDSEDFPRNYDLCISVRSRSSRLRNANTGLKEDLRNRHPNSDNKLTDQGPVSDIAVFAQWVKLHPDDSPDMSWFNGLEEECFFSEGVRQLPMSEMVKMWLFRANREFDLPYVKRTLSTNSSTLERDRWPDWISSHIDEICTENHGLFVSAQMQCFGGKFSSFTTNADNGTSYSWRDSRLGVTIDCFHEDRTRHAAEKWQENTDKMIGPEGVFARQERRFLWGSFGDWNMDKFWQYYYDNSAKYERLQKVLSFS